MARKRKPAPLNEITTVTTSSPCAHSPSSDTKSTDINTSTNTRINTSTNTNTGHDNSSPRSGSGSGSAVVWLQPSAYDSIKSLWQDHYIWSPVAVDASLTPDRTSFILMDESAHAKNDSNDIIISSSSSSNRDSQVDARTVSQKPKDYTLPSQQHRGSRRRKNRRGRIEEKALESHIRTESHIQAPRGKKAKLCRPLRRPDSYCQLQEGA
ncbi:hypothetical protein HD806DRAFT_185651 [Xylariaceae sp. AK1471]|nr:hypothetical protein HD806DRAFT_185651 [Xylariaceae sp. AK1471]